MKYLLDASVLLPLITTHGKRLLDEALRQRLFTTDLAIYEACNSLWKLSTLLRSITTENAEDAATVIKDIVAHKIIEAISHDEIGLAKTLELAQKEKITFYDASYIVAAKTREATLTTQDRKLRKIAKKYVETITYQNFEKNLL